MENTENKKPKNPNAFPWEYDNGDFQSGMTLRDYFAAAALTGLASKMFTNQTNDRESVVKQSYDLADKMLKQREL